jgi:hypothetical protein
MCISPIHRGQYQSNVRWLIESPSECDVTMTSNSLLRSVGIGVELGMHWLPPKSPMRACPESELHAVLIRRELIDCNMLWRQQNLVRHRPDCCNPFFSFARLSAFRSSTLRISTGCHRAVVANSDALFSSQHFHVCHHRSQRPEDRRNLHCSISDREPLRGTLARRRTVHRSDGAYVMMAPKRSTQIWNIAESRLVTQLEAKTDSKTEKSRRVVQPKRLGIEANCSR